MFYVSSDPMHTGTVLSAYILAQNAHMHESLLVHIYNMCCMVECMQEDGYSADVPAHTHMHICTHMYTQCIPYRPRTRP